MRRAAMALPNPVWLLVTLALIAVWGFRLMARVLRDKGRYGHWWKVTVVDDREPAPVPVQVRVLPKGRG